MSETAIRVTGVGKCYRIGRAPVNLREAIMRRLRHPLARDLSRKSLWAVRDVSFEVARGQAVAILGRNGAGKSTILRMLSRITEPTEGTIEMFGQVGSLLEVGTGFHPELTGRENIFLNGAILGMTRREVKRKFDEIVAFAETEEFLETPVKHYSTGMYTRLAFAVAAHFEPEILVVDEVLAVGDAAFQRKCLGKMEDVGREGRTVVFVTHDMGAANRLCQRAILLDRGRVVETGATADVVRAYLGQGLVNPSVREWTGAASELPGDDWVRLRAVRVRTEAGATPHVFDIRKPLRIEIEFEVLKGGRVLVPNFHLFNERGEHVFFAMDLDPEWRRRARPPGRYASSARIPGNFLAEGMHAVGPAITTYEPLCVHFYERDAVSFQVVDTTDGDSARGDYGGLIPGVVRPLLEWTTRSL